MGEEQPEEAQDEVTKLNPERERFSVPHASRDLKIFKDMNLKNENIFEIIRNPPEVGAVRIFEKTWILGFDNRPHPCSDHTRHSHDSATIRNSQHGRSTMAPSETYPNER